MDTDGDVVNKPDEVVTTVTPTSLLMIVGVEDVSIVDKPIVVAVVARVNVVDEYSESEDDGKATRASVKTSVEVVDDSPGVTVTARYVVVAVMGVDVTGVTITGLSDVTPGADTDVTVAYIMTPDVDAEAACTGDDNESDDEPPPVTIPADGVATSGVVSEGCCNEPDDVEVAAAAEREKGLLRVDITNCGVGSSDDDDDDDPDSAVALTRP